MSDLAHRVESFRALRGVAPFRARLAVGNLGVEDWGVWARQDAGSAADSASEVVGSQPRHRRRVGREAGSPEPASGSRSSKPWR